MRVLEAVGWWMLVPCLVPVGIGRIVLRKMRRKKAKWKNDVRPLPRRRKSLSIASPSSTSSTNPTNTNHKLTKTPKTPKIPPNPQLDCALLARLPLELRLEIYAYVFGGTVIHLIQIPRRIAHTRCRLPAAPDPVRECRPAIRVPLHPRLGMVATANVALLKTCRQIYTEAAHVLYAVNTFDVNQLSTFIGFSRTVIPSRLAAITRLHLSWTTVDMTFASMDRDGLGQWYRCWCIIASDMPGLRDMKLCMGADTAFSMQEKWVVPLCEVRGLRRFELSVEGQAGTRKKEMAALRILERRLAAVMTRAARPE